MKTMLSSAFSSVLLAPLELQYPMQCVVCSMSRSVSHQSTQHPKFHAEGHLWQDILDLGPTVCWPLRKAGPR